jgi:hypothetical protein
MAYGISSLKYIPRFVYCQNMFNFAPESANILSFLSTLNLLMRYLYKSYEIIKWHMLWIIKQTLISPRFLKHVYAYVAHILTLNIGTKL